MVFAHDGEIHAFRHIIGHDRFRCGLPPFFRQFFSIQRVFFCGFFGQFFFIWKAFFGGFFGQFFSIWDVFFSTFFGKCFSIRIIYFSSFFNISFSSCILPDLRGSGIPCKVFQCVVSLRMVLQCLLFPQEFRYFLESHSVHVKSVFFTRPAHDNDIAHAHGMAPVIFRIVPLIKACIQCVKGITRLQRGFINLSVILRSDFQAVFFHILHLHEKNIPAGRILDDLIDREPVFVMAVLAGSFPLLHSLSNIIGHFIDDLRGRDPDRVHRFMKCFRVLPAAPGSQIRNAVV